MKTPLSYSAWSSKDLRRLDAEGAISHNWQAQWDYARANIAYMDFCTAIAESEGPVLEVAAGPGGGNLSPLLHIDPALDIVLNDIEPGITERWQLFLDETLPGHRVTFATFDICHMPFEDATFACVSSSGGFSTMLGAHSAALEECARVLKPGGLVYAHELTLTEACLSKMPEALRKALIYHPWLFRCWDSLLSDAGLSRIILNNVDRRKLSPGESPLATDAAMFDAEIEVERILLVARTIEGTVKLNREGKTCMTC